MDPAQFPHIDLWVSMLASLALLLWMAPNVLRMNQGRVLQNIAIWLAFMVGLVFVYQNFIAEPVSFDSGGFDAQGFASENQDAGDQRGDESPEGGNSPEDTKSYKDFKSRKDFKSSKDREPSIRQSGSREFSI